MDDLIVDLQSKVILEAHLQCASHEMPLSIEDEVYFGPLMKDLCEAKLLKDADGWWVSILQLISRLTKLNRYHTNPKFLPSPAKHIALRGAQEEKYTLVDVTKSGTQLKIVEEVEVSRALFEIYEGGVVSIRPGVQSCFLIFVVIVHPPGLDVHSECQDRRSNTANLNYPYRSKKLVTIQNSLKL